MIRRQNNNHDHMNNASNKHTNANTNGVRMAAPSLGSPHRATSLRKTTNATEVITSLLTPNLSPNGLLIWDISAPFELELLLLKLVLQDLGSGFEPFIVRVTFIIKGKRLQLHGVFVVLGSGLLNLV